MEFRLFKNATFFTLAELPPALSQPEELQKQLEAFKQFPLEEKGEFSRGFVCPIMDENRSELFHQIDDVTLFAYAETKRIIDHSTVNAKAKSRIDAILEKGGEVDAQLDSDIHETAKKELMPFFRISHVVVRGYIDHKHSMLIVDSASDTKAEILTSALRKALGSFRCSHLKTSIKPFIRMGEWFSDEESKVPAFLSLDSSKMLNAKGLDSAKKEMRFKSVDLDNDNTREMMCFMGITKMPAGFYDFSAEGDEKPLLATIIINSSPQYKNTTTNDLRITSIKFMGLIDILSDDIAELNSMLFLMKEVISRLLASLFTEFCHEDDENLVRFAGSHSQEEQEQFATAKMKIMSDELDELFSDAKAFVSESRRGTVSAIQRKFKIGYNRAARIIEQLEDCGVVSSPNGSGLREVLIGCYLTEGKEECHAE